MGCRRLSPISRMSARRHYARYCTPLHILLFLEYTRRGDTWKLHAARVRRDWGVAWQKGGILITRSKMVGVVCVLYLHPSSHLLSASTLSEVVESPPRPTSFLPCIFATPHTGMSAEMGSRLLAPLFVYALQGLFLVPTALLYPRA